MNLDNLPAGTRLEFEKTWNKTGFTFRYTAIKTLDGQWFVLEERGTRLFNRSDFAGFYGNTDGER